MNGTVAGLPDFVPDYSDGLAAASHGSSLLTPIGTLFLLLKEYQAELVDVKRFFWGEGNQPSDRYLNRILNVEITVLILGILLGVCLFS